MRREHTCRIVREQAAPTPSSKLYWSGSNLDRFDPRRSHESEAVEVSVEDEGGDRLAMERLLREPEY